MNGSSGMPWNPERTPNAPAKGRRLRRIIRIAGPVLAIALTAPVDAQSESERRQEVSRQNQRINDLKSEVSALEERLQAMEDLIARLQTELAAMRAGSEASTETTSPPTTTVANPEPVSEPTPAPNGRPTKVFRDPSTILDALRWDFRSDLTKDPSFALGINANSERARAEANSILSSWIVQMNRKYQQAVTWPVRITPTDAETPDLFVIQVLTPDGEEAGAPFELTISRPIARRIDNWLEKPSLERFLLKGTFLPALSSLDPEEEPSTEPVEDTDGAGTTSDQPVVQVSPYVRFDYSLRLSTILPVFQTEIDDTEPTDGS